MFNREDAVKLLIESKKIEEWIDHLIPEVKKVIAALPNDAEELRPRLEGTLNALYADGYKIFSAQQKTHTEIGYQALMELVESTKAFVDESYDFIESVKQRLFQEHPELFEQEPEPEANEPIPEGGFLELMLPTLDERSGYKSESESDDETMNTFKGKPSAVVSKSKYSHFDDDSSYDDSDDETMSAFKGKPSAVVSKSKDDTKPKAEDKSKDEDQKKSTANDTSSRPRTK